MPDFDKVFSFKISNSSDTAYWSKLYNAYTKSDIINLMMRHSGHKWLHNKESLKLIAEKCGYKAVFTTCEKSKSKALSGINIRSEKDSFSFAADLIKYKPLKKIKVKPSNVSNATLVNDDNDHFFYKSLNEDPQVYYEFPDVPAKNIVLINARMFNFDSGYDHNITQFFFEQNEANSFYPDKSMTSFRYNNYVQGDLIKINTIQPYINSIRVDPTNKKDTIFYVGFLEIFYY